MATEKEKLQKKAEEMGLDTEGTKAQLKEAIKAAEAEEGGLGDTSVEATNAINEDSTIDPPAPGEVAPADELPEEPVNPEEVPKPKATVSGPQEYEVLSSFYLMTKGGSKIASTGGRVKLTEKQAAKYLRVGVVKLAA